MSAMRDPEERHSSRRRRLIHAATAGSAAALLIAATASANLSVQRLGTDTYSNTSSQHATQVEPDSFAVGSTIVAAVQTGRFTDGGSSNVAWATSTNAGSSWTGGNLPGTTIYASPAGTYARVTDPAVAYDARHGAWLISTLALVNGSGGPKGAAVLTSRSLDGGLTWGNPVVTAAASGGSDYDKNWIACDNTSTSPFYGNCYTAWDDFGHRNKVLISTSSDGGQTWGAPTSNRATVIGAIPVPLPNGNVVIVTANAYETAILSFVSTNGGATWSKAQNVTTISEHGTAGGIRAGALPSAEMDGSGRIYLVWDDCRFRTKCTSNDIVMTTSTNGTTWTPVARVPIDDTTSTVDHFIPGIGVDPATSGGSAKIGITYYYYPVAACSSSTCALDVGFISSTNGGSSWSSPTQIAGPMTLSWLANTTQGRMVGDYISTSVVGGVAWPLFCLANAPSGGVFDEAMYTATGGIGVIGGSVVNSAVVVASAHGDAVSAAHRR
jgi:hypothetical protein